MFERFTRDAREAVTHAHADAQAVGADHVGSEHVLLGLTFGTDSVAVRALGRLGVDRDRIVAAVHALPHEGIDAQALAGIGIDLDAVRATAEQTFGPGALDARGHGRKPLAHVPFDASAKKMLELALREAVRLTHNRIDSGHLLLAAVRATDSRAHHVLWELGAGADAVRDAVAAVWAEGDTR